MTIYQCHCGQAHDSATTPPCPRVIDPITGLYPLGSIDRFLICSALRVRHPTPSREIQRLLDLLAPTPAEQSANLAYVRVQVERYGNVKKIESQ